MNIPDFPQGHIERRGDIAVMHSFRTQLGKRISVWRFQIAVISKLGPDAWVQMTRDEIQGLTDDRILNLAANRLVLLALNDPQCRLLDGRLLSDIDPVYLYTTLA